MSELGILLDARSVHPGLSARNNLLALARTAGIGRRRVDEVIELAGLAEVAGTRAGGFSLGMGQRLGMAAALLGRPQTVVLAKLGLRDRVQAVVLAYESGLITPGTPRPTDPASRTEAPSPACAPGEKRTVEPLCDWQRVLG